MEAKLIVEGREFSIEIQDPELQKILMPKKKIGYERVGSQKTYYYYQSLGDFIDTTYDVYDVSDIVNYDNANYYSDKTVAENNARADKLMRQLRRFAVEHRKEVIDWSDIYDEKYCIRYNYEKQSVECNVSYAHIFGGTYFDTQESVNLAIETFHDELIWYFTEYKDSL